MPSADKQGLNDHVLTRYLLGSLPAEETERLDELSVADDEFVLRLDAIENDLVDAYARGDLSGDTLEQFQKFYLSSPRRREKVEFARTLISFGEKTARAVAGATTRPRIPDTKSTDQTSQGRSPRRWFSVSGLGLQWGFAAIALVLLLASGYLFTENALFRRQRAQSRDQAIALEHRAQELERQLAEQRSANAGTLKELDRLRAAFAAPRALRIVAALLLPQMRGASQIATVSVPVGTNQVQLRLQLESDDFPAYQAALKDPAESRVIWHKSKVRARAEGEAKVVSINIPAGLLKHQNYVIELTGISSNGRKEFISGYPMRVVPE
ncbi:MAG TPA: hypothetical protein VNB49_16940 [Candidatus Dormibacteraeota bacterium]|nr:hypothetical protein [Candidatus Dormibacteraeota bacterium]